MKILSTLVFLTSLTSLLSGCALFEPDSSSLAYRGDDISAYAAQKTALQLPMMNWAYHLQ
jgi:hypothetical protein